METFEHYMEVLRKLGREAEAAELESRIEVLKSKRGGGQDP